MKEIEKIEAHNFEGAELTYWNRDWYYMRCDIRNPKHMEALEAVLKQFGFN